jgi:hypothetical protein
MPMSAAPDKSTTKEDVDLLDMTQDDPFASGRRRPCLPPKDVTATISEDVKVLYRQGVVTAEDSIDVKVTGTITLLNISSRSEEAPESPSSCRCVVSVLPPSDAALSQLECHGGEAVGISGTSFVCSTPTMTKQQVCVCVCVCVMVCV